MFSPNFKGLSLSNKTQLEELAIIWKSMFPFACGTEPIPATNL
jgi:hypothetical protein